VYLGNCAEMIDIYVACVSLGIIFVPINILYREREIAHIIRDADPAAVVVDGPLLADAATWQLADLASESAAADPRSAVPPLDGDDIAAIIYTSGTTGAAKGAMLTHNNFAANAITLNASWQISSADRFLLGLPLFHVHGLANGVHCWLLSGCRMRLLERFDHRQAQETLLDFRPTLFFGVPTMYVRMLDLDEAAAREIGRRMRLFVSGSAPLPARVLEDFESRFGHGRAATGFGWIPAAGRVRADQGRGRERAARRRNGRTVHPRRQCFRRVLAAQRCNKGGIRKRVL
jgi:malonyl-CoA/methylmalonyl-CoA synthetase